MNDILPLRSLLPERIARLADLATDLWWASSAEARILFRMVSHRLWRHTEHNPVKLLRRVTPERLAMLAIDRIFLEYYDRFMLLYDTELNRKDTFVSENYPEFAGKTIAYFSAEYGFHSSLPIYSGGLGVLAGDHVKTTGDIGLPLIAVGFLYPYGYFEQHIAQNGDQIAQYAHLQFENTPLELVTKDDGSPLTITLHPEGEADELHLQVWRLKVGRSTVYLMDSDLELNSPDDREITKRLYGGDKIYRLRQEIALGLGGVRALTALGVKPDVWHANEGHASFMFVERVKMEVEAGASLLEAVAKVRATSIFTTHTPVPAGHDAFEHDLIARYFPKTIAALGITKEDFFNFGKHKDESGTEMFNLTALAFNMTEHRNAVSKKHEEVTKRMWPEYGGIGSVTNGVHIPTWLSQEWAQLFTSVLSHDWKRQLHDPSFWLKIHQIPDEIVWDVRLALNENLRRHLSSTLRNLKTANVDSELIPRGALFDPNSLTVGFARRFATYKRATILFRDPDRLARILNNPRMPVQIIFSGKSHPADGGGQQLIRTVWDYANDPAFKGKIYFLENYSMHSAKFLVQGVDMWLNTPRVPLEASGTSGMKAAINGVPNLSVLDGWWCEGYNGRNGWAVQSPEDATPDEQDDHDALALYELLEEEIVPLYYDRDLNNIPHGWVQVAKESMATLIPQFTSERMLSEYIDKYYKKALR